MKLQSVIRGAACALLAEEVAARSLATKSTWSIMALPRESSSAAPEVALFTWPDTTQWESTRSSVRHLMPPPSTMEVRSRYTLALSSNRMPWWCMPATPGTMFSLLGGKATRQPAMPMVAESATAQLTSSSTNKVSASDSMKSACCRKLVPEVVVNTPPEMATRSVSVYAIPVLGVVYWACAAEGRSRPVSSRCRVRKAEVVVRNTMAAKVTHGHRSMLKRMGLLLPGNRDLAPLNVRLRAQISSKPPPTWSTVPCT